MYVVLDDVAIGYVPMSIDDIVKFMPEFFDDHVMLITIVDSDNSADRLRHAYFKSMGVELENFGDAILIRAESLKNLIKQGWTMDGFDEIFLLKEPVVAELPVMRVDFTRANFNECVPREFTQKFESLHASRFLADGSGLNFACEPELADRILQLDRELLTDTNYLKKGTTEAAQVADSTRPTRKKYLPLQPQ